MMRIVEACSAIGMGAEEIAHGLDVDPRTLYRWINRFARFREEYAGAVKKGRARLSSMVRRNLVTMAQERTADGKFTSAAVAANIYLHKQLPRDDEMPSVGALMSAGAGPAMIEGTVVGEAEGVAGERGNGIGNGNGARNVGAGGYSALEIGLILAEMDRAGVLGPAIDAGRGAADDAIHSPPAHGEAGGVPESDDP